MSLVLFPIPHLCAFRPTHGQPHPPCHPVNLCCPALSAPPTDCVCDLAAVMDLSPCLTSSASSSSSSFTFPGMTTLTHPPLLLISPLYIVPPPLNPETRSECTRDVCEHFYVCKHACTGMFDADGGGTVQPILRFQFIEVFPLIHEKKNLPYAFLCFMSLLVPKALRTSSSGTIEPFKAGPLSGRAPHTAAALAPGRRKRPHGGAPSLTSSSSQAKALLASLSAAGLTTEALLLSSTLRYHRLLREQRASSAPLPGSQRSSPTPTPPASPSSSCCSSPTTLTPSLSPSPPCPLTSLIYSSAFVNGSACSPDSSILNNCKDSGNEAGNKDVTPGDASRR